MLKDVLEKEIKYRAVTSSGPGGQNVNKVATKVVLELDLINSKAFTEHEHELILLKLQNRLTKDGILILGCQETRSQIKNKELVLKRLLLLLGEATTIPKVRKKRTIPYSVKKKRLQDKKLHSDKKSLRKFKPE